MTHTPNAAAGLRPWPGWLLVLAALLPPAFWASSIVVAKLVVMSLPPFTAATARFVLATAILWALWLALPGQRQPVQRGDWGWLAVAGLFQTSLYFALQYLGVGYTSGSSAAVIVNVRPIFVLILAVLFLRERLTILKVLAIVLGFLGVLVITTKGSLLSLSLSSGHALGDLLIVLDALSGAIGLVLTKKVLGRYRPFQALVWTITFGTIGLLPFAAGEILQRGGVPATGWLPWVLLAYQAVFTSLVAHILWNNVLTRLEATQAAVFLYVSPVVGVILAWWLLGDQITIWLALGTVLIILAAFFSNRAATRPKVSLSGTADAAWRH